MLTDNFNNDIRTLTWRSVKGNLCKLFIFSKTKQFTFELSKDNLIIKEPTSNQFIDAIIGLINIHMKYKKEQETKNIINKDPFSDVMNNLFGKGLF